MGSRQRTVRRAPPGPRAALLGTALLALSGAVRGETERTEFSVWIEAAFDADGQVVATHAWDGQPAVLVNLADKAVREKRLDPATIDSRVERFAVSFALAESDDGDLIVESVTTARATPKPIDMREPAYPLGEVAHNREGWVDVMFTVTPDGRTDAVEILGSEPHARFDMLVEKTVRAWRFEAQVLPGVLVNPVYRQRIAFQIGR